MRRRALGAALVAFALALPVPATAQDVYTIGLTGALTGLAGLFGSRLLLRQSSRDEHVLAGGEAGTFDPDLPPGSGSWRGAVVQVARSASGALPPTASPR